MDTHDTTTKVPIAAKVAPELRKAIERIAEDDDRSVSNVIERVLKQSPDIQAHLDESVNNGKSK